MSWYLMMPGFLICRLLEFFVTNNFKVIFSTQLSGDIDIKLWPHQLHVLQVDIKLFKLKHPNIILYDLVYAETNYSGIRITLSKLKLIALHKRWSFPVRISLVNLRIWSHLLEKYLTQKFIFYAVLTVALLNFSLRAYIHDYLTNEWWGG